MYFEQFYTERNIKDETIKSYRSTIKRYTKYYGMELDDLIKEAIDEETRILDKRRRSIRTRLMQFRTHLVSETDLRISTIKGHMGNLYTLYAHFEVDLPKLPPLKNDDKVEITYYDLPTKEQIGMAVGIAGIRVGSLILMMTSSGTGRTECANMTIQDFCDACSKYYTSEKLEDIITELYGYTEPIVPTFYILRQKTNKMYYTFCTPECANAIIEWLMLRLEICKSKDKILTFEDKLWDLSKRQITYHLSNINDDLGLGFKGPYRFLRPHTLRKFHASNIGLSQENIDLLQGRSRDSVHETYIKTNPDLLRKTYMNVMDNVTIGKIGKKEIVHQDFTININLNFYGYGQTITL